MTATESQPVWAFTANNDYFFTISEFSEKMNDALREFDLTTLTSIDHLFGLWTIHANTVARRWMIEMVPDTDWTNESTLDALGALVAGFCVAFDLHIQSLCDPADQPA